MKGGYDMTEEREVFRFDLHESLYFEKGQEVSEMLSISLDPEISIQPFEDEVSIRGVIELVGEYRRHPSSTMDTEDEVSYFNHHHTKRFIEVVEHVREDLSYFSHRFPVEISIPAYRIDRIEDVTVHIESFDYELPSDHQLVIKANVDIYGIAQEAAEMRSHPKDKSLEDVEFDQEQLELDETFQFDIKYREDHEDVTQGDNIETDQPIEEEQEKIDVDEERWKVKSQTFEEFFDQESNSSLPAEDEENVPHSDSDYKEDEEKENDDFIEQMDHSTDDHDNGEDELVEDEERDFDYLTALFRDHKGETTQATMRVRIVQSGDTLEEISERYNVPLMQLQRQNQLVDDEIYEGQLLYIPFQYKTVDDE